MIFRSIREYIELYPNCQFCGNPMATRIAGQYRNYSSYVMDYQKTVFKTPAEIDMDNIIRKLSFDTPQINFISRETENNLWYSYEIDDVAHPILSVDKDTGKLEGDIDKLQKIFWEHNLSIVRACKNQECKNSEQGYICDSEKLKLERKNGVILPFRLEIEAINVNINNTKFVLSTMYTNNTTHVMALDKSDFVKQLPFMPLHKMRGAELITNKIKTILVFS